MLTGKIINIFMIIYLSSKVWISTFCVHLIVRKWKTEIIPTSKEFIKGQEQQLEICVSQDCCTLCSQTSKHRKIYFDWYFIWHINLLLYHLSHKLFRCNILHTIYGSPHARSLKKYSQLELQRIAAYLEQSTEFLYSPPKICMSNLLLQHGWPVSEAELKDLPGWSLLALGSTNVIFLWYMFS